MKASVISKHPSKRGNLFTGNYRGSTGDFRGRAGWFTKCQHLCNLIAEGQSQDQLLGLCQVFLTAEPTGSKWCRVTTCMAAHVVANEWTAAVNMANAVWGGDGEFTPHPGADHQPGPALAEQDPEAYIQYIGGGGEGSAAPAGAAPAGADDGAAQAPEEAEEFAAAFDATDEAYGDEELAQDAYGDEEQADGAYGDEDAYGAEEQADEAYGAEEQADEGDEAASEEPVEEEPVEEEDEEEEPWQHEEGISPVDAREGWEYP